MNQQDVSSFHQALEFHEFELTKNAKQQILKYCELLWTANQSLNLTRHTDFDTFVARDLMDVMQLSRLIGDGQEVLDIGSGGGVPGLVLAIVRPDLQISLCESTGKKAIVLQQFIDELKIPVGMFADRAESVLEDLRFDCCTARAVGPMWKLLTWLDDRWLHVRRLLALKGPRWVQEVTEAKERKLTKGLLIKPVAKYPLHSTDKDAELIESFIIEVKPAG